MAISKDKKNEINGIKVYRMLFEDIDGTLWERRTHDKDVYDEYMRKRRAMNSLPLLETNRGNKQVIETDGLPEIF